MKNLLNGYFPKRKIVRFSGVAILFLLFLSPNLSAQNLSSSNWTSWMMMRQNVCMKRAEEALKIANVRVTENTVWYVVGKAKDLNVRIKCIADDNSNNLINSKVRRILVDLEVEGLTANLKNLTRLRNCVKQFIQKGESTCWSKKTSITSQVYVSARDLWQKTGVIVKAGDRLKLSVTGDVQYTPRKNATNRGRCNPSGVPGFQRYSVNPAWNHCAVIGRIGKQVFLIGRDVMFTAKQSGMLELRINDTDTGNNNGEFIASITLN